MPTSNDEVKKIVRIINAHVDRETAMKITEQLYEEVGRHTENESLKVSLQMLYTIYKRND